MELIDALAGCMFAGKIHALHKTTGETIQVVETGAEGIMGLSLDPTATKLYFADAPAHQVKVVDISQPCVAADMVQGTGEGSGSRV